MPTRLARTGTAKDGVPMKTRRMESNTYLITIKDCGRMFGEQIAGDLLKLSLHKQLSRIVYSLDTEK
jgi:hypothetical protein